MRTDPKLEEIKKAFANAARELRDYTLAQAAVLSDTTGDDKIYIAFGASQKDIRDIAA